MDSLDYYERYAIPYYEETVELSMEEELDKFIEFLPENAEVLDLGCGSGRDTLYMEEQGVAVTPMDGSARMCELASIHTDRDVLNLRVEDMTFDEVFDGIWMSALLGHFTLEEAKGIMQKTIDALKDGGILYFSVRKGDRDGRYSGRYFYDYNRDALNELLDSLSNINVLEIWKTIDKQDDDEKWFNVLLRKEIED